MELKLRAFVKKHNHEYLSKKWEVNDENTDQNIKLWEQAFREVGPLIIIVFNNNGSVYVEIYFLQETLQYNPPEVVGDDEVFAEAYHSLVHSPMLGTVLRKESALNSLIRELRRQQNTEVEELKER